MIPLLLGDILRAIGVPGSIVLVAVAVFAVYHLRGGRQTLSKVGFVTEIVAAVGVLLVAAAAGLIPGVTLEIAWTTFIGWVSGAVDIIMTGVRVSLDALGVSLEVTAA